MKKEKLHITLTFTEPLLATASGNPELHRDFIAARASEFKGDERNAEALAKEEIETLPDAEEMIGKASTVFHRDDGGLFIYDYAIRGHIKEQLGSLCQLGEFQKLSVWTFKKACDCCIFVDPRRVRLFRNGSAILVPDGTLQRPLRASTMRGDRVALANSEYVEAGSSCSFEISLLVSSNQRSAWHEITTDILLKCFEMGERTGVGQWRSGGYGRYTFTHS